MHEHSSFLTLTYDDSHLPAGGTLVPRDAQLFMHRLRTYYRRATGNKLRFYLVGEYGDQTWRPHYHAALYGIGPQSLDIVLKAWGKGHIVLGDLTPESAQYIAGYINKKLTYKADPRLTGRHPEFSRQSNRPGIGSLAIEAIVDSMGRSNTIPSQIRLHGRMLPIGRYLKSKIILASGITDTGKADYEQEMLSLWQTALLDTESPPVNPTQVLLKHNRQKVLNFEAKLNLYKKEKIL